MYVIPAMVQIFHQLQQSIAGRRAYEATTNGAVRHNNVVIQFVRAANEARA